MIRYDQTPLPLLPAYSTMTRLLEGKRFVKNLSRYPNVVCQVYQGLKVKKPSLPFGHSSERNYDIHFPAETCWRELTLTLLNMIGETQFVTASSATFPNNAEALITNEMPIRVIGLSVSPEPAYIILPEYLSEQLDALEIRMMSR